MYIYIYDGIVCLSLSRQKRRLRHTRQFHNRDGSLACGSFEAYNSWDLCRFTPQHIVVFYPTPSVDWDIMAYTPLTDHVQLASRIMFVALSHVDENDLTATSLELCLLKGIIPRWTEGIWVILGKFIQTHQEGDPIHSFFTTEIYIHHWTIGVPKSRSNQVLKQPSNHGDLTPEDEETGLLLGKYSYCDSWLVKDSQTYPIYK